MHILFYSNWYLKQTVQLANALVADHRVTLIFPDESPELHSYDGHVAGLQEILEAGVELITMPYMQKFGLRAWVPVLKAKRIIRKLEPDVIHLNESYDFRSLLLMRLCHGIPFVTSCHDPVPHSSEEISLRWFKHRVRDRIRHGSDALVVHGKNLRQVLADYSSLPIEKIYAVPHGEYRYYTHFDQEDGTQNKNGRKDVLFFGRWDHYKGIDVLINAEPHITERVPEARITLAGEGSVSLDELHDRMVHPEHFIIKNYAIPDEEVPEIFRKTDVVVLPYREATQSGPLHIAGTFAKPAVVSRVGAMQEVVQDGDTGILVSPGDPEELAEAVCRLLENPVEAERMGASAQARMAHEASMETVAVAQAEVYQNAIATRLSELRQGFMVRLVQALVKRVKQNPHYELDGALRTGDLVSMLLKLSAGFLRGLYHRPFLAGAKGALFIGKRARFRNSGHITLGRNFVAEDGCEIQGLSRQGVRFGDNVTVGSCAMVRPSGYYGRHLGEGLTIGDRSNIGPYCYLGAYGGITIGKDVMMGPRVSLFAENHNFDKLDVSMREQGCTKREIIVEDDCWLGSGSIILAGVKIGKGSVVAAGAVVTSNIPEYSIAAGNPARVIRSRK
jgi:acetyltransferase-like isoleucine patch superfamily enzyme/glycosyltransferase involved in cell wall biosynthesis